MPILQLPPHLVNQIAAGEVLARAASAVKELLENSLDAKSSLIELTVIRSGLDLIRVRDNGEGIAAEDLPLALAPHATSKLHAFEDLHSLKSFGFRGEALASLAAVSELQITSKVSHSSCGHTITAREGKLSAVSAAAHPQGTSIEARDLFFNVPVRRQFLRSPKTEWSAILAICEAMALTHPDVEFLIKNDHRIGLHVPKVTSTEENRYFSRLRQIFKLRDHQVHYVSNEEREALEKVQIFGWIVPALVPQRRLFFMNGRAVKNLMLQQALRTAILETQSDQEHSLRLGDDYSFVFFVNLSAAEVDVNVHPAKEEVRFREPLKVHHALFSAVRCALIRGAHAAPETIKCAEPSFPSLSLLSAPFQPSALECGAALSESGEGEGLKDSFISPAEISAHFFKTEPALLPRSNLSKESEILSDLPSSLPQTLELGEFLGCYHHTFLLFRTQEMLHAYKLRTLMRCALIQALSSGNSTPLDLPCLLELPEFLRNSFEKNASIWGFRVSFHDPQILLLEVPQVLKEIAWPEQWMTFLSAAFSKENGTFLGWQKALEPFLDHLIPTNESDLRQWISAFQTLALPEAEALKLYRERSSFSLKAWLNP